MGAASNANDVFDLQTYTVQDQLSGEAHRLRASVQELVLPGEVDFYIRQDLDLVDPENFTRALPDTALVVPASARYFVPNLGYDSTGSVADLYHAVFDMWREPGGPDDAADAVFSFQPQAWAVQDQLSNACRSRERPFSRHHGLLPEKQDIRA